MACGSPDRARIPAVSGSGGAKIFGIDLLRQPVRSLPNGLDKKTIEMTQSRDRALGLMTGVLPVVDRGELFFQDNAHVYAVTAYLLAINKIIGENDVMNAQTLPKVKMPNRDNFIIRFPDRI